MRRTERREGESEKKREERKEGKRERGRTVIQG